MNFLFRTLSSVILVSAFLLAVLWEAAGARIFFLIFAATLTFLCVFEFLRIIRQSGRKSYPVLTASTGALMITTSILSGAVSLLAPALFAVICWIMVLRAGKDREVLERVLNSAAGLVLILIPLGCLAGIYLGGENGPESGKKYFLFLIIVAKAGDIGAYLTGTLTNRWLKGGNHKIIPAISPKKSWEGVGGGLFLCVLSSILTWKYLTLGSGHSFSFVFMLGALIFIGGFAGDLAESSLKRLGEIKDSGAIIPGIGGVLDLLDSFLINAPVFYCLLNYQGLA